MDDQWTLNKKDRYIINRTHDLVSKSVAFESIHPQVFQHAEAIAIAEWEQYERKALAEYERRKAWDASPEGQAAKAKRVVERLKRATELDEELKRREAEAERKLRRRWWKFWDGAE